MCKAVLWIGVSFEQSAPCEYFRVVAEACPADAIQVPSYV